MPLCTAAGLLAAAKAEDAMKAFVFAETAAIFSVEVAVFGCLANNSRDGSHLGAHTQAPQHCSR